MKNNNYLPKENKAKLEWLKQFSDKLPQYGQTFEFSEIELASIIKETEVFMAYLQADNVFNHEVDYDRIRNSEEPFQIPAWLHRRLARTISRIKNHPNYQSEMGKDLNLYVVEEDLVADATAIDRYN